MSEQQQQQQQPPQQQHIGNSNSGTEEEMLLQLLYTRRQRQQQQMQEGTMNGGGGGGNPVTTLTESEAEQLQKLRDQQQEQQGRRNSLVNAFCDTPVPSAGNVNNRSISPFNANMDNSSMRYPSLVGGMGGNMFGAMQMNNFHMGNMDPYLHQDGFGGHHPGVVFPPPPPPQGHQDYPARMMMPSGIFPSMNGVHPSAMGPAFMMDRERMMDLNFYGHTREQLAQAQAHTEKLLLREQLQHRQIQQNKKSQEFGKKKRTPTRKKASNNKPRRPLSAYNLFFSEERERILKEIDQKAALEKGEEGDTKKVSDNEDDNGKKDTESKGNDSNDNDGDKKEERKAGCDDNEDNKEGDETVVKASSSSPPSASKDAGDGEDKDSGKGDKDKNKDKGDDEVEDDKKRKIPTAFLKSLLPGQRKRRAHRKTHGKISFRLLAQMVGARWKALPSHERKYYQDLAKEDSIRQKEAMKEFYRMEQQQQNEDHHERSINISELKPANIILPKDKRLTSGDSKGQKAVDNGNAINKSHVDIESGSTNINPVDANEGKFEV